MNLKDQSPYSASRLDLFASNLLEVSNTTVKDFLLVEPYSIGDAIHSLSLITAFRNKHCMNGEKVNFICNNRALPVVNLFKNIDFAIGANLAPHEYQLEALADRYGPIPIGRPIPMPPDMYARGWLSRLCGKGLLSPLDAKKMILELDIDTLPNLPDLDKDLMQEMQSKANRWGLSSNSIIIFNHANTMKEVDEKIFRPLQKIWKDRIFYDATVEGKGIVEWAKPIKMTIEEVPYFTQYAGFAICIRSGITDLLALSDANVITIYPNQSMLYDWSGNKKEVMKGFRNLTLEKLRLSERAREFPIFCEDDDSVDSIADRLNSLLA